MSIYIPKKRGDILRNALEKIERDTPIQATTIGSVARAFTEAITTEIADLYDVLEYNMSQAGISSASGRHLDAIGELYGVQRASVTNTTTIARETGSFYFYVDAPAPAGGITIPARTRISTSSGGNYVAHGLSYITTEEVTIPTGETKAYASIRPDFGANEVTAEKGTLISNDAYVPGHVIHCTNPKPIYAQTGYESDNNYKARIIKRLSVQATGSLDSIRYSILGLTNVRDAQVFSNRMGLGVAEVVLVPEEGRFTTREMNDIKRAVENARPAGIRVVYTVPRNLGANVKALLFVNSASLRAGEELTIVERCYSAWRAYLNGLLPGEPLVYNKLIDIAFGSSNKVLDVTITDFTVAGSTVVRGTYKPKPDEMIIPGELDITLSYFS